MTAYLPAVDAVFDTYELLENIIASMRPTHSTPQAEPARRGISWPRVRSASKLHAACSQHCHSRKAYHRCIWTSPSAPGRCICRRTHSRSTRCSTVLSGAPGPFESVFLSIRPLQRACMLRSSASTLRIRRSPPSFFELLTTTTCGNAMGRPSGTNGACSARFAGLKGSLSPT